MRNTISSGLALLLLCWVGSARGFEIQPRSLTKSGFPPPSGAALTAAEYDNALFGLSSLGLARGTTQTLAASGQIDCRSNAIVPVAGSGGPVTLTSDPQLLPPTDLPSTKACFLEGTSNTNTLTISDGNGVDLGGSPLTLGLRDLVLLVYNGSQWLLVLGGGDGVGSSTDAAAIHDNVANEIMAIADKAIPVGADRMLIEDSAAGMAKKDITVSSLETALEVVLDLPDLQGTLTVAKGGTGGTPGAGDQVNVSDASTATTWRTLPDCHTGNMLTYTQATNTFGCELDDVGAVGTGITDGDKQDIVVSGSGTVWNLDAGVVGNPELAPMPPSTFKGNNTIGTATPLDLTVAEATALLNTFTSTLKGLVPPSGGGTATFLRADGTWAPSLGGGDVTTAVSLATAHFEGDTDFGTCTWTDPDTTVHVCACDAAKTGCFTAHIPLYDVPMQLQNTSGQVCQTIDNVTGLVSYHGTGDCARPRIAKPFDASIFSPGTGVTLESVSLNGWPAMSGLDGPDSDAGVFSLTVPVLWDDYAPGSVTTLQLTCHSLTNQNGLTLMVRVGPVVCVGDTETLPAFVAPTSGTPLTCSFGNQTSDIRFSNEVTLVTSGCVAGKRLHIPFVSEADMTAAWSTTTAVITGGVLRYESAGSPVVLSYAPVTPVLDNCNRTEAAPMTHSGLWDGGNIDGDELGALEATGTTCSKSSVAGAGSVYSAALYGPDMEAYVTIASTATTGTLHLYIRLSDVELLSPLGAEGIGAAIDEAADTLQLVRLDNGGHTAISAAVPQETSIGDIILLRAVDEAISLVYCPGGTNCVVKATAIEGSYLDQGRIGFRSNTQANLLDNFGGGTLP